MFPVIASLLLACSDNRPTFDTEEQRLIVGSWTRTDTPKSSHKVVSFGEDGAMTYWSLKEDELKQGAYRWDAPGKLHSRRWLALGEELRLISLEEDVLSLTKNTMEIVNGGKHFTYKRINIPETPETRKLIGTWVAGPEVNIDNKFMKMLLSLKDGELVHKIEPKFEQIEFRSDGTADIKSAEYDEFRDVKEVPINLWVAGDNKLGVFYLNHVAEFELKLTGDTLSLLEGDKIIGPYTKRASRVTDRPIDEFWVDESLYHRVTNFFK